MVSIENKVLSQIRAIKKGALIFPEDFKHIGSSEAVRVALHRLEKEGMIKRVAQGIYVRPKISKYVGQVLPSAEEVATAIAKRDFIRIVPTGNYALNVLGLSTQVPMKLVLLTDGSSREVRVGERTIKFKKTTPKNLMAKGIKSGLVIQALKEYGKGLVSDTDEARIIQILREEKKEDLLHDIGLAPVWIQKIMRKAL